MSEKAKKPEQAKQNVQAGNAVEGGPKNCKADGCKSKIEKFGFCKDHYELFMEGIIRADGQKPLDYEEKLSRFKRNRSKVA